jgi:glycosyltransferase A (GT-A) superfamily protein (DUF2064 family)
MRALSVISEFSSAEATLLIFCKQPRLHQGKQRIAATLGAEKAYQIASGLLECALEDAAKWQGPVVLSPARFSEEAWAAQLLSTAKVYAQDQGNLGQRIMAVDKKIRSTGQQKIIVMGTDAPILDDVFFQQALHALENYDVVFSSAEDGGVTLMGSNLPWPDIEHLPWSTERLGKALHDACVDAGYSVSYIAPSYDIDLETDLMKLSIDLEMDKRPSRQALQRILNPMIEQKVIVN